MSGPGNLITENTREKAGPNNNIDPQKARNTDPAVESPEKAEVKEKLQMITFIKKYKSIILYLFFGGMTTLINIIVYLVCYDLAGISNVVSNIAAWALSVLFAFITNKLWVFESKSMDWPVIRKEFVSFVGGRLGTGLLDLIIMYIGVDLLSAPAFPIKIASNVIVIILNYVLSKLWVFKEK